MKLKCSRAFANPKLDLSTSNVIILRAYSLLHQQQCEWAGNWLNTYWKEVFPPPELSFFPPFQKSSRGAYTERSVVIHVSLKASNHWRICNFINLYFFFCSFTFCFNAHNIFVVFCLKSSVKMIFPHCLPGLNSSCFGKYDSGNFVCTYRIHSITVQVSNPLELFITRVLPVWYSFFFFLSTLLGEGVLSFYECLPETMS